VTRLQFSRRGDGLAAPVAWLLAGLIVAALVAGAGAKAFCLGLAAVLLTGTGVHLTMRTRRFRRTHLVLGDVGDLWRALLIGAPPALFSV